MTRNSQQEGARTFLRPPMGNQAFYSREYLSIARSSVLKVWGQGSSNSLKREVALTLLADPELRLRICHLEELLHGRQLASKQQANGYTSVMANGGATPAGRDQPQVHLQTALADPAFAALFELDSTVNDPDWGMQVLWLNMTQLQKELGLMPPPAPPPAVVAVATAATSGGSGATANRASPRPRPPAAVPEPALLSAFETAFPNHPTDDEEYLAVATCYCLATRRDPKALLPPLSLHLTDLTAHLRSFAAFDARLAAVLQRVAMITAAAHGEGAAAAAAPPLAARVAELLAAPKARQVFRQSESLSRKGERVVGLAMEQLTRLTHDFDGGGFGGGTLPYGAWQRAGTAMPTGGTAGDRLPVFLFEYEAPSDVYGREDQYGAAEHWPAAGGATGGGGARARGAGSSPSAASPSPLPVVAAGSGGGLHAASSSSSIPNTNLSMPAPPESQQQLQPWQQQLLLQPPQTQIAPLKHACFDSSRVPPSGAAAAAVATSHNGQLLSPPQPLLRQQKLKSISSEPVPLPYSSGSERVTAARMPPASSDGGGGAAAAPVADTQGFSGPRLGLGAAGWPSGSSTTGLEGTSPSNSFSNGMRATFLDGNGQEILPLQHTAAGNGGSSASATGPPSFVMTAAAATTTATTTSTSLGAPPGGPSSAELHVPPEIAEVWYNSSAFSGGGGLASRRGSATAASGGGGGGGGMSGLQAEGGRNGVLAASPTQENSYIWDRMAARTVVQPQQPAAADNDLAALGGLSGLGLGYSMSAASTAALMGGGSSAAAMGSPLHVGSAPSMFLLQPYHSGCALQPPAPTPPLPRGSGPANGLALGLSGGGSSVLGSGATLMDHASWQSSSPELSNSVCGRSAPADNGPAFESWILSYESRVNGRCCGGSAAAARQHEVSVPAAAAAAPAGGGRGGRTAAAAVAVGSGPSPSVSEASEETTNLVGGLDLDPVAMTLEALIGFDPTSAQLDPAIAARRATISSPTAAVSSLIANDSGNAVAKGLIAAAAAPKLEAAAAPAGNDTSVSRGSCGGGGGAVATADGSSRYSSVDSSEVLNGGGGGATAVTGAVLTSWSAMAARGPAPPPSSAHQNAATAAGLHLAATAAGGGSSGCRIGGVPPSHGLLALHAGTTPGMVSVQCFAATMARQASLGGGAVTAAAMLTSPQPPTGSLATGLSALPPAGPVVVRDVLGARVLHPRLSPRVREEICQLIRTVQGLKAEDFDDGVLHQLALKRSEEEAVGALRTLASENLSGIQHMAAYVNHIIKNYHHLTAGGAGGAAGGGPAGAATAASLPSATVRANSTPVSSKAILQRLPLRVFRRLEELIAGCSYMEWKHFDAGVVKVLAQLSELGEEDVFEELELLRATDLSNVEYMPAYLNKRLNNRLWSRRKMLSSAAATGAAGLAPGTGALSAMGGA